jgi:hypothetical protein
MQFSVEGHHRSAAGLVAVAALVVTLVGFALAAGAPAGAASLPKVTGVWRYDAQSASDSLTPKRTTAVCPAGQVVLGGGARISKPGGPDSPDDGITNKVALTQMEPFRSNGTGRYGYAVRAAEIAGGTTHDWYLTAFAICADPVDGYHIVIHHSDGGLSSATDRQSIAACPNGQRVLGSGARINTFPLDDQHQQGLGLQVVRASGPGDIVRTEATEQAAGYADSWELLAFAVCASTPQGYQVTPYGESPQRASEDLKWARIDCPGDKHLLGAGATVGIAPANVTLNDIYVFPGDGTISEAHENSPTGQTWTLASQAICAD